MLKVLHTADWHVGRSFGKQFEPEDALKLSRARFSVIDRILGEADHFNVDAVLCAGDLFDNQNPGEKCWRHVIRSFARQKAWRRPVVLLPGNHDPLTPDSVYSSNHPFRKELPEWVKVVDRDDYKLEISDDAVIYAAPCRAKASDKNLALSLPAREAGDTRVRIGLVHGSTFDMEGYATNFPISRDAPEKQGLDYLATGDWHSFREIPEGAVAPIVYPSTPEPTSFKEQDPGFVALVSFGKHAMQRPIRRVEVKRWKWQDRIVQSIAELRALAAEDLLSTVLRLRLELTVSLTEKTELDDILSSFRGTLTTNPRAGVFVYDPNSIVRIETGDGPPPEQLPDAVRATWARLDQEATAAKDHPMLCPCQHCEAKRALLILQRFVYEVTCASSLAGG